MTATLVFGFTPTGWSTQYQDLSAPGIGEKYFTDALCYIGAGLVGVSNSNPMVYEALYPWDPPWAQKSLCRAQSKCALFCLAVLRGAGMALPEDGKAVAWRFGTVKPPAGVKAPLEPVSQLRGLPGYHSGPATPVRGDMVIIQRPGSSLSTHALLVIDVDGDVVTSLDGGTGPVRIAKRRLVTQGGNQALHDSVMGTRRVLGILKPFEARGLIRRDWMDCA